MTGGGVSGDVRRAVRAQFAAWAEVYTPGISPLYEALSRIVADHDELVDLAAGVRPGQPVPNMLFGAVHMVLLDGEADPQLGRFYPGLGGSDGPDAPGLEAAFLGFCRKHRDRLAEIIGTRVTNTNEVQRCACLMPAFVEVSRAFRGAPFHLVEIGPSAGLNLLWDRYAYRYTADDGALLSVGEEREDGLVLRCALRGEGRPALDGPWPPALSSRLGIERNPVDLTDPDERMWLRALIWPEHLERAQRLERALKLAAAGPPPVRQGDALELLPGILDALPQGEPVCVEHSFVLPQFTPEQRDRLGAQLAEAAANRPVLRIGYESQADRQEAVLFLEDAGRGALRRLAFCESHGAWLEWRLTSHGR
ncbi:MAG: DUF2332 domain-containing protein [Alphaproteobacteria bacterium]